MWTKLLQAINCIGGSQPCTTKVQESASAVFYQLAPLAREEELISETCCWVALKKSAD